MEKKYTFAIDVDEVLRSLLKTMVEIYNKNFNENLGVDDIKDFIVENSFPKIQETTGIPASKWFFQDHGEELFCKSEAFPGIKEDIETLQLYGKVIIVTYQKTYKNKIDTLNWLMDHGIFPDGVCFLKDKTLILPDFMIDDNEHNFINCNAKTGILITAPYNKDIDVTELWKKSNCKNMYRYDSLHTFVKDFVAREKFLDAVSMQ